MIYIPISITENHSMQNGLNVMIHSNIYETVSLISCKLGLHRKINVHPEIQ